MSAAAQTLSPDPAIILAWLDYWFDRCNRGCIAIVSANPGNGALVHERRFRLDQKAEAAAYAAEINKTPGVHVYFGGATVDPDMPRETERSGDKHVVQAPGTWIDFDSPEHEEAFRNIEPLHIRPNSQSITGTKPCLRSHRNLRFSEPLADQNMIREVNHRFHLLYGGDPIMNPSRVLRLPGTINWPMKKGKIVPGRQEELVMWRRVDGTPSTYPIGSVLAQLPKLDAAPIAPAVTVVDAVASATGRKSVAELRATLRSSEPGRHDALLRLTAHYVGDGLSDEEIWALCKDFGDVPDHTGKTETPDEWAVTVGKLVHGARDKFNAPDQDRPSDTPHEKAAAIFGAAPLDGASTAHLPPLPASAQPKTFGFLSLDDMERIHGQPPVFLMDNLLPEACTTLVTGPSGAGKSPWIHKLMAHLLLGMPFAGHECRPCRVVVCAAESEHQAAMNIPHFVRQLGHVDPSTSLDEATGGRFLSLTSYRTDGTQNPPFLLEQDTEAFLAELDKKCAPDGPFAGNDPDIIVIDTLRAASVGSPMNDEDMAVIQQKVALMRARFPRVVVILVHHSAKGDPVGSLGSNRIPAMAENWFNVIPVERDSANEDETSLKRLKWYGPDKEDWQYTTFRVVHMRIKVWRLAMPHTIVMRAKENTIELLPGPHGAAVMKFAVDGVAPHDTVASPPDETGFAAGVAGARSRVNARDAAADAAEIIYFVLKQSKGGMQMGAIRNALWSMTFTPEVAAALCMNGTTDNQRIYINRRLHSLADEGRVKLEGDRANAVWKAL